MANTPSVELKNVVKKFGDVTAVDHISLQIEDGEFFSLLGPSGCGKTTTLRMIAGFEMPTAGTLFINGEQQGYRPPYQRPVNTVFQHYALFPHMTVAQNVEFGLEMQNVTKPERKRRVAEVLELVHLSDMGPRRPKQLSGGQQQRVALARALINRPRVLLLDEPLGALDLKLRKAMQLELKNLQEEVGITFIYVTHDQEEAITMSDRIAVMSEGQILQVGSPIEIYENPNHRFVADFIGESNFLNGTLTQSGQAPRIRLDKKTEITAGWAEERLVPGDSAMLSIRPEKIQLFAYNTHLDEPGSTNIHGKIKQAIYLGTDMRYLVELSSGSELIARMQNTGDKNLQFGAGDLVTVSWPVNQGRILRD